MQGLLEHNDRARCVSGFSEQNRKVAQGRREAWLDLECTLQARDRALLVEACFLQLGVRIVGDRIVRYARERTLGVGHCRLDVAGLVANRR